jgi:hypothetical protein
LYFILTKFKTAVVATTSRSLVQQKWPSRLISGNYRDTILQTGRDRKAKLLTKKSEQITSPFLISCEGIIRRTLQNKEPINPKNHLKHQERLQKVLTVAYYYVRQESTQESTNCFC